MSQIIHWHTLPNGLTLLAERMPHVRSAAFSFMVPSGAVNDPPANPGTASVFIDLISRGAGTRSSRELSDAMDSLGLDRGESNGLINQNFSGSLLARNLPAALELYADMLLRPHLPEEELEPAQALAIQDIQALEDEPQDKVMVELRKNYYPDPLNRDRRGTIEGIESLTIDVLRDYHRTQFHPSGVILAVAGDIDWESLKGQVETLFGDWSGPERQPLRPGTAKPRTVHLSKDLEQTQIALAFPSVAVNDPDFYRVRGVVGVLSNDMSARLFANVREKYGLCYSIYASYEAFKDRGTIIGYTGGRPENAQRLVDLFLAEFRNLKNGIGEDEVDRVKIGLKASLIMRQESTGARASSIASDWYFLGRIRPLEEIQAQIDSLSAAALLEYLDRHPFSEFAAATLGPAPLTFN